MARSWDVILGVEEEAPIFVGQAGGGDGYQTRAETVRVCMSVRWIAESETAKGNRVWTRDGDLE
jgi:hypothetical protein